MTACGVLAITLTSALTLTFADGLPLANFQMDDFAGSGNCALCHTALTDQGGHDVSIDTHWRSSMMANGAKDPLWQAKVSSEVARNPALKSVIEKKCATCHTPMATTQAGVLAQPIHLLDGGFFNPTNAFHTVAMDGISCSLCHQVQAGNLGTPDSFSGGYSIDTSTDAPDRQIHGPFANPIVQQMRNNLGYTPVEGAHMADSALCGVCHNLYTPYVDAQGAVQGEFPEQMIYSEWEHSAFNGGPDPRECQDCHMPAADGGVILSNRGGPGLGLQERSPFGRHHFVGGNQFMLGIFSDHLAELGISASTEQLAATRQRTMDQLQQQSARLIPTALRLGDSHIEFDLQVENFAGHKLPSGFPSRRAWLHVRVADAGGTVFFESGKPLPDGRIEGNDADVDILACEPHYASVSRPDQVQIYEAVMQNTDGAVTHTLLRAAAYRKDNRLLPPGFSIATASPDIAAYGRASQDTDFIGGSDRITYNVKTDEHPGPYQISAELLYQTVAWSFAQDLFTDSADTVTRFSGYYEAADHTPTVLASCETELDPAQVYQLAPPNMQPNGSAALPIRGPVGGSIALNWSSNLTEWIRLSSVTQTGLITHVSDTNAASATQRYYRLDQP